MTTYYAVPGSGLTDKDAAVIGPEVARLEKRGASRVHDVLTAARDRQSPLHRYVFDCSRSDAADRYYLHNAGHVVRSIQVEVVTRRKPDSEPVPHRMRAFYPVHRDDASSEEDDGRERHYVSISTVLRSVDYSTQVWREGLRYLQLFRSRFKDYDDIFGPVIAAIDETEAKLSEERAA